MTASTRDRLVNGALWIGASRIALNLIALLSTLILARLLVPEDFGLVAIAESVAIIVISVTELSLAHALIQHKDPAKHHYDTAWTLNIARAIALALLIAALAFPAAAIYDDPRLLELLFVIGATTIISACENPKIITFHRDLIFWQDFVLNVLSKIAGFIVAVGLAYAYQTYWALILGSVAAQLMRVIVSYVIRPYMPRPSLRGYKELLSFSVWLTLGTGIKTINHRSDTLAVGLFVSQSIVGFYTMGGRLAFLPVKEGLGPIKSTLFPAFSRMQDNIKRLQAAYLKAQGILCTLAFPVGAGLALVAEPLVVVLIGEKWLPAVPIVQVLSLVSAFQVIESSQQLAMSLGHTRKIFQREMRVFLIRLPLIAAGLAIGLSTPVGPIMGMIFGRALASFMNVYWNLHLVKEISALSIRHQLLPAARPALAAGIMTLAVAFLPLFDFGAVGDDELLPNLVAQIALGASVYVSALSLLWLIAGRPEGAERETWAIATDLVGKLKPQS